MEYYSFSKKLFFLCEEPILPPKKGKRGQGGRSSGVLECGSSKVEEVEERKFRLRKDGQVR